LNYADYNNELHKAPAVAVDGLLLRDVRVLLIKRNKDPYKDHLAVPGGFVDFAESAEDAIVREMREETGLEVRVKRIFDVRSGYGRDPRGHTISIVFLLDEIGGELKAGDDAAEADFFPLDAFKKLDVKAAFDHAEIIYDLGSFFYKSKDPIFKRLG